MHLLYIIFFQATLTFLLLRLSGALGNLALGAGYSSMMRAHTTDAFSFNIFYRLLFVPVSLCALALFIYWIKLDFLLQNIWLVAIWYFLLHLLLSFVKLRYTKITWYFGTALGSIFISHFFYVHAISLGPDAIFPETDNFRTEIWFIVFAFFYEILRKSDVGIDDDVRNQRLADRYDYLKKRFETALTAEFRQNKILNDILFSIMMYEDMVRPRPFRIFERLLFKTGLVKTTGIMQTKASKPLSDEKSIEIAQKIILDTYNTKRSGLNEYQIVDEIITAYNPDAYYRQEVRFMYGQVRDLSHFLELKWSRESPHTAESLSKMLKEFKSKQLIPKSKIAEFDSLSQSILLGPTNEIPSHLDLVELLVTLEFISKEEAVKTARSIALTYSNSRN